MAPCTLEVPVQSMDCAACAAHVRQAVARVPGVVSVHVPLGAGQVVVQLDPTRADREAVVKAVEAAGYQVPAGQPGARQRAAGGDRAGVTVTAVAGARRVLGLLGALVGAVLFAVIVGEWLGVFEAVSRRLPWPLGLAAVAVGGFPVFRTVVRAAWRGRVTAHALMTLGVLAAMALGEWATAAVVVFFMRVGDYAERFTVGRARHAVRDLLALAPRIARVERGDFQIETPVEDVRPGDVVVVRPGEAVPVDGEVVAGRATVDQAAITGEAMPVEVGPGARVFAAALVRMGSLRVRTTHVGPDSTFGRVIRLVQDAETHRADLQRAADRFAAFYLPVVAAIAGLTLLVRRDPLAAAAVLVVACSCGFALATPIAVLASIGAAARRGILVKGGRVLEALARADVLLIDKTGTLTLGRPQITAVVPLNGATAEEVLALAAAAERDSEHPLAEAVRAAARARGLVARAPDHVEMIPGVGVRAVLDGALVTVGRCDAADAGMLPGEVDALQADGRTLMVVRRDDAPVGVLAAADATRAEVPAALADLRALGFRHIEILTGDHEGAAAAVAGELGVAYRARLLPEEKIAVVRDYQARGHTVVMVGDGVNDAPALAQADVGIAMGAAGSAIALEAGHAGLMRDDWRLLPDMVRIARRTLRVVWSNLSVTAAYNVGGLVLAALGYLPLALAAAAQALPDLGILANSTRLLRWQTPRRSRP
ncbi:MAG: cation-translocating P-type ATPase [Armatimonadota bacterium]|nr:cation-translocating P-type ATPase [Armatimonadota bacterium]MDR7536809.1 cation-translocating P-type ATPase [Armatimonadota bacterium]